MLARPGLPVRPQLSRAQRDLVEALLDLDDLIQATREALGGKLNRKDGTLRPGARQLVKLHERRAAVLEQFLGKRGRR